MFVVMVVVVLVVVVVVGVVVVVVVVVVVRFRWVSHKQALMVWVGTSLSRVRCV